MLATNPQFLKLETLLYSKRWSVRNRVLGLARLDFLSGLRNRAIARLDFLSGLRNRAIFLIAACGGAGEIKGSAGVFCFKTPVAWLVARSVSAESLRSRCGAKRGLPHTHVFDVGVLLVRGLQVDGAVHRVSGGELRKDRLALAAVELVALGLEALQDLVLILRLARRELLVVELVARGLEAKQGLVLIFRTLVAEEGCGKGDRGRRRWRADVHVRRPRRRPHTAAVHMSAAGSCSYTRQRERRAV
jgi:hypothetical protein